MSNNKISNNKISNNKISNNKINLLNKSSAYEYKEENVFSNIYLIVSIFVIALIFIGYAVYYYINKNNNLAITANSSYYGTDIALYEPIFQNTTTTINDCINICKNDITCDGITYNSNTQMCSGTKNGQLRNETANYSAWVKPDDYKINNNDIKKDFTKAVLVGNTTVTTTIDSVKLQNPYLIGFFAYSFNLTIYDFYKNYGSWRHIFHKGTPINRDIIIDYQSWENLVKDFPIQSIGVWLAPFTNNLRIAVTTTSLGNSNNGSYADAFIEKCNSITGDCYITDMPGGKWVDKKRAGDNSTPNTQLNTYIEYFDSDLQNIPINKQVNITINFRGSDAEVYYDGKIIKVVKLDGTPTLTKSSLYVMNDKSFGGEINNLLYYPDALTLENIKDVISLTAPQPTL